MLFKILGGAASRVSAFAPQPGRPDDTDLSGSDTTDTRSDESQTDEQENLVCLILFFFFVVSLAHPLQISVYSKAQSRPSGSTPTPTPPPFLAPLVLASATASSSDFAGASAQTSSQPVSKPRPRYRRFFPSMDDELSDTGRSIFPAIMTDSRARRQGLQSTTLSPACCPSKYCHDRVPPLVSPKLFKMLQDSLLHDGSDMCSRSKLEALMCLQIDAEVQRDILIRAAITKGWPPTLDLQLLVDRTLRNKTLLEAVLLSLSAKEQCPSWIQLTDAFELQLVSDDPDILMQAQSLAHVG